MKRIMFCAVVVAIAASSAVAVPVLYQIAPISDGSGTETVSAGRAITPDGRYVAVASTSAGSPAAGSGAMWDVTNGTRRVRDVPGNLSFDATGIGYRTVSGQQQLVVHAGASGPRECYWTSADGGATWGRYKPGFTTSFSSGTTNTLAGSSTDAFYGAYDSTSLLVYGVKGTGDPPTFVGSPKSTTTATYTKGVSSACPVAGKQFRVVGSRADGSGNPQNYVMDYDGTVAAPANWYPWGLQGNRLGELWAINADTGARAAGMSPVLGGRAGKWPFILDNPVADGGTATELPTFLPTIAGYTTNGIVYGLSGNGRYAVGMDYTLGYELAVLWDTQTMTEMNLTQFAIDNGILGNFTGNLRRAYAVGVDALGNPVITGYGYDTVAGNYRGFVLTLPEPATLSFLLAGSLLLLRRRR